MAKKTDASKTGAPIVRPRPLTGFKRRRAVYIPVDSPSGILRRAVEKVSLKKKKDPLADIHLLEKRIAVLGAIGAPNAVLILERLIASGVEEVVILGFCGSLNTRTRLLDALLVVEAFSEEGTSPHYLPGEKMFFPSPPLHEAIEAGLQRRGLPYLTGSLVSTDAPYRETPEWLENNLGRGVDGVDMETSAVFALARHRKIQAAALLLVSDELRRDGHVSGFLHPGLDDRLREYFLPFIREEFSE